MALSGISLRERGYKMDNVSRQAAGWDGRFPDDLDQIFALKNKGKKLKTFNNKNVCMIFSCTSRLISK